MLHTLLHRCRSWFDPGRGPRHPARRARLARLAAEALEGRAVPAALTQFVFNLPPSVESRGVELAIFGQKALPAGSPAQFLYLSGTTSNPASFAYKEVPNVSGQLPADGMIPLTDGSVVQIPTDVLVGGEAVLFVGPDSGIATSAQPNSPTGSVAVPTVGTNPNDIFSLFELTNLSTATGTLQLDLDISDIDQVGFPYTVTSSAPAGSATPAISAAPYPLGVVGQTVDRRTLLASFQAAFPDASSPFQESWRLGIDATGTFQRLVSPQDVLSVFQADGPRMVPVAQGQPQYPGATYKVTAISSTGETRADTGLAALLVDGGGLVRWQPYTGIQAGAGTEFLRGGTPTTGYKIYKSTNGTDYGLIGQVGASASSFPDPALTPDLSKAPPANSYGFDPLSTYFTEAIQDFFSYYTSPREFVYDQAPQVQGSSARTTWRGSTVTNYQPAGEAHEYTALVLTGHGGDFDGHQVAILSPLFSSNTNQPGLPPMPNYLVNGGTAPYASPSQMVFACNGVFADNAINPSAAGNANLQTALGNIQNVIVSALNRGLTSYNDPAASPADPGLQPDQWVNPLLFAADPVASPGGPTPASSLAGRYYYVVTTVLPGGETVPTREVVATLQPGDNRVSLSWLPINGNPDPSLNPVGYRVYRSTSPGAEVLIAELGPDQTTGWTDEFTATPLGGPPPFQFYATGNVSNLYSAFLHRNSTTEPAGGISVNGLAYGYPFDDQGSFSTNIQYAAGLAPATVTFDLMPWTNSSAAPTTTTLAYSPGSPVTGQPVTLVATVVPASGGTPGGAVVFVVDGVAQAPVPLTVSGGQAMATLVLNGLAAGDHTVVAIYSGDETDAPSESSTLPLVVASPVPGSRVASTTQLAISPDPAAPGQPLTLSATVTRTVGGGIPGGTVIFAINGVAQPPAPLAVVGGRSVASLVVPGLPAGNYAVTAAYSGDASALPSTSAPATLAVVNASDGPSVVRVDRFGYHAAPTTLAIRFLGALDAVRATDVESYRIFGPGGGRIRIRSASYDAATSTVTLSPARRLSLHRPYRLTVVGTPPAGLTNTAGVYLNGSGSPGTDYSTRLTAANLVSGGPIPTGPPRLARWARVGGR